MLEIRDLEIAYGAIRAVREVLVMALGALFLVLPPR